MMERGCCSGRWKTIFLVIAILAMVVLHQDFWNWKAIHPLVFGFLPIGLAYHAAYAIACAVLMWVLVRVAWPKHLEEVPERKGNDQAGGH